MCAVLVSLDGTAFWLYTFYAIAQVPIGDGTGFQWLAVRPLGAIFLGPTLPSLCLRRWVGSCSYHSFWVAQDCLHLRFYGSNCSRILS
jgi:hypothetical protein